MAAPLIGAGYLRVIDRMMDASRVLFEPVVNQSFPANISSGSQTVNVFDPSIYVGSVLVCGTGNDLEVITVTAATGTSFTATFANAHTAGEPILGATFPVRYPTDPLLTQPEMLAYMSTAVNDFLTDCPLCYNLADITVPPAGQNTPLPADSLWPARIASGSYPLRESSQADLDSMYYNWNLYPLSQPKVFFRDKVPLQNVGVWPRAGNTVDLEVVYAQRQAQTLGWADGFLFPDSLTQYVLYKTLSFTFSKDGEIRSPALAKYFASRYSMGVKICNMLLEAINDPNLQLAAS